MSAQCFDALSRLMKEGPLHILFFASEKPAFAIRAAEGISALVDELGILTVRFFSDIMHPLIGILSFPSISARAESQWCVISTCRALQSLLWASQACEPAKRWRGALLAGTVKCWATLRESKVGRREEVERALKGLVSALLQWDDRLQVGAAHCQGADCSQLIAFWLLRTRQHSLEPTTSFKHYLQPSDTPSCLDPLRRH